jgi:hypothetical protein
MNTFYRSGTASGDTVNIGASGGSPTNIWTLVTPTVVDANNFSYDAGTKLITYNGTPTIGVSINCRVAFSKNYFTGIEQFTIQIYINGTGVANTIASQDIDRDNESCGALIVTLNTELSTGDTIDMRVQDIETGGATASIDMYSANLGIIGYSL